MRGGISDGGPSEAGGGDGDGGPNEAGGWRWRWRAERGASGRAGMTEEMRTSCRRVTGAGSSVTKGNGSVSATWLVSVPGQVKLVLLVSGD